MAHRFRCHVIAMDMHPEAVFEAVKTRPPPQRFGGMLCGHAVVGMRWVGAGLVVVGGDGFIIKWSAAVTRNGTCKCPFLDDEVDINQWVLQTGGNYMPLDEERYKKYYCITIYSNGKVTRQPI
jgi:hypothetical protein